MRSLRRTAFLALLATVATACGEGGTEVQAGPPAQLSPKINDAQTGVVAQQLANDLSAKVVDAAGLPVANAVVVWAGDGAVSAASTRSSADGTITNRWTLGTRAGPQTLEARWINPDSGEPVVLGTFTATAAPGPAGSLAMAPGMSGGAYGYGISPYTTPAFLVMDEYGNAVPFRLEAEQPLGVQGTVEGTEAGRTLVVLNEAEWTKVRPDPNRPGDCTRLVVPVRVISGGRVVATAEANNEGGSTIRVTYKTSTLPVRQPPVGGDTPATPPPATTSHCIPQSYSIVYLGTLGGAQSRALAINNNGQVVGRAQRADGTWRAFSWRDGQMTMLDTLSAPTRSHDAYGLNDRGDVVGESNGDAVVWRAGRITRLGIGGKDTLATASGINEAGAIIGGWVVPMERSPTHPSASFIVQDGQVTQITSTPFSRYRHHAVAINTAGQVVGQMFHTQAFLYDKGEVKVIVGAPVTDINDQGQIVGYDYRIPDTFMYPQGYLREGSTVTLVYLSSCPIGICSSRAESINRYGYVVGHTVNTTPPRSADAFVWHRGTGLSLSKLSGRTVLWAHAINDAGQIVGLGVNPATGQEEAVLLNPVR